MQGTIDIAKVIFDKIEKCDVFIADVTLVGKYKKGKIFNKNIKYIPNCNVMLELGYAAAILSWERVILVFNEKYGRPDDLPFDLRQHRLIIFWAIC